MSVSSNESAKHMVGQIVATVQPLDLKNAVSRVIKATSKRSDIPILKGLRLEAAADGVIVGATDTELYLSERIPAEVQGTGVIVLPARPIALLLRLVPRAAVIRLESNIRSLTLTMSWDSCSYTIHGWSADTYPQISELNRQGMVVMEPLRLRQMFERVAWTMSHDESRPWLTGVRLRATAEEIRLVATQGICIGRASAPAMGGLGDGDLIIPGESVREMIKILKRTKEERATITWGTHPGATMVNVQLQAGDSLAVSRTLEGQYPDVERLVPQVYPDAVEIPLRPFVGALKRLSIMARDGVTKWTFLPNQTVQLMANTPEIWQAVERISADVSTTLAEDFSIGFDARFFIELLSTWDCERIRIEFSGSRNPVRVSPVGAEHPYDSFILPLITF